MVVTKTKHIPQRTCVGCRSTDAKRQFVRLVRTLDGRIEVDEAGKRPGRGAYICSRAECWSEALKKDRLAHALRTTLAPEDRLALEQYATRVETVAVGSAG
jgi:predicted RNA-binding protein YlxR (DUF448 family)